MGASLGNLTSGFEQFVTSKGFKDVVAPGATVIIGNLGNALFHIADAFGKIWIAATPLAE